MIAMYHDLRRQEWASVGAVGGNSFLVKIKVFLQFQCHCVSFTVSLVRPSFLIFDEVCLLILYLMQLCPSLQYEV